MLTVLRGAVAALVIPWSLAVIGVVFRAAYEGLPARRAQVDVGPVSRAADRTWARIARVEARVAKERHSALRAELLAEAARLDRPPEILEFDDREAATEGTYGRLPEIRVDEGRGAIFPIPIAPPARFSWFQAATVAGRALRDLRRAERELAAWRRIPNAPVDAKLEAFIPLDRLLTKIESELGALGQQVRYLESWVSHLERQWDQGEEAGEAPISYLLVRAIRSGGDAKTFEVAREVFRPHRVVRHSYVPERLSRAPGGILVLPIATDIHDARFLAEIEGAVDTHWNQSPWAKQEGVSVHLRWTRVRRNRAFAEGRVTLAEHVESFPSNTAVLTTGGLTVHVKGRALVLGPGRIQPRTLAHEIGHLLGFEDCYFRTLSSQGVFGLAVLEWDNPLYPDDLMCDNTVGVARAEAW